MFALYIPVVVSFLILTFASAVRTTAGFGFSMIAVPLLALEINSKVAVVAVGILTLPLSIWSAYVWRKHINKRITAIATITGIAGVPVGLSVLQLCGEKTLLAVIATMVLLGTWIVWRQITIPGGMYAIGIVSFLTGVCFGATGVHGTAIVAVCQSMHLDNKAMKASLGVVSSFTATISIIQYILGHHVTTDVGYLVFLGIPAFFLGATVGEKIFKKLTCDHFRKFTLMLLIISSSSIMMKLMDIQ